MQFFDLSRQFNLDEMITPPLTLIDLTHQNWYLSKIRIEHDCLDESELIAGQVVLRSNQNVEIELEWIIHDTGHELQVLFKGIESETTDQSGIMVKGARLCDIDQKPLSAQALSLWIDGTLLPLMPYIRSDIKSRLNLWDYVQYDS